MIGTKIEGLFRWARLVLPDCKISLKKQGAGFHFCARNRETGEILFEHKGESQDDQGAVTKWLLEEMKRRERIRRQGLC
jgi:hypothetical protein